jgi:DNA polymerase III delta prime subunit
MKDLLNFPKRTRMPNLLLVGPTKNGKTTMIVEKFHRAHPATPASQTESGAAYVQIISRRCLFLNSRLSTRGSLIHGLTAFENERHTLGGSLAPAEQRCSADDSRSAPHKPKGEAIGLTLDRGIEHLDRVLIVLVREHGAFRVQYESGRLHLLANGCRLNPMQ